MCGIAGIVGMVRPDDLQRCTRLSRELRHRGPDDSGTWSFVADDGFGATLIHRRLAIIDLRALAGQPMVSRVSGTTLIFNGEIYNFRELRRELEAAGSKFLTNGDSEVILNGFDQWGTDVFARLRGMFAVALFDPSREEAILARDGYGIKPLYWTVRGDADSGRSFGFASESRALVNAGLAEPRTDPFRVGRYLHNGFMPGPQTIWTQVSEVPRGTYCRIGKETETPDFHRFWSIDATFRTSAHPSEAVAEQSINDCVAAHLTADVAKVVFLSGGVDSTAIAVAASRAPGRLSTMSIGFAEAIADESAFAETVARAIGSEHTAVRLAPRDIMDSIDDALGSLDQPSFDAINSWFVSREAVRRGFKVALAGSGGDELTGGYTSFKRALFASRLFSVAGSRPAAAVAGFIMGAIAPSSKAGEGSRALGDWVKMYQAQYALFNRATLRALSADDGALSPWGLSDERLRELQNAVSGLPVLSAISVLESELFLGDRLLRDTDCVSMAHSLEVRLPLVDTRLADDLGGLSDTSRFLPIGEKRILRRASAAALPPDFFSRPKRGFEFPMDEWMRGPLRPMIEADLLDGEACARMGLDGLAVAALWKRFCDYPRSIYWTRPWALFALLRWGAINGASCR